jgi:hypothetical protein
MADATGATTPGSTDVEIITFEWNHVYGIASVPREKAFAAFMHACEDLNPADACFSKSAKAIFYVEASCCDHPRTIMMLCTVTDELVARVLQGIAARQVVK